MILDNMNLKEKFNQDKKALFVFIEGADGVGKSTITNNIIKTLLDQNLAVAATHLVKHTRGGAAFYLDWTSGSISGLPAALVMLGVTVNTLEDIKQSEENYDVIIVDRSQASFFAYQFTDSINKENLLEAYNTTLKANFYKHCNFTTIYLECDSKVTAQRMVENRGQLDAIETKGSDYQDKVKGLYETCFYSYPQLSPGIRINTGVTDIEACRKMAVDFIQSKLKESPK